MELSSNKDFQKNWITNGKPKFSKIIDRSRDETKWLIDALLYLLVPYNKIGWWIKSYGNGRCYHR